MIQLESISKYYGNNQVLRGINLIIAKGETHGIVGKNGSGKTTLFRSLLGLEKCEGQIIIESDQTLKDVTGYLPTNPPIINRVTGKEYLTLLSAARKQSVDWKGFTNLFDLPLDQYIETYSTGMRKKLALQGILLQKNEVFVLDEPFSGLDYQSCIIVSELLNRMKNMGKTILLSSHIFSTLKETCDHIHYLDQGVIAQSAVNSQFDQIEKVLQQELVGDKLEGLDF